MESRTTSAARQKDRKAGGGLHTHTLCTPVGKRGWVRAALPSLQRGMYMGRSWERTDYLHTPAAGARKVGYSWETGIPVSPTIVCYQDAEPKCKTHPHLLDGEIPASSGIPGSALGQ